MSTKPDQLAGQSTDLERHLARMLHRGTWLGSAVIAAGLVLALAPETGDWGTGLMAAGIALFILLPVARVSLMAMTFLREGDYRFGAIALLVLAIIALGALVGIFAGQA
ncbi:MAG: DUF1634 domain-containing protein [Rhodospirillaceae bacterium]|nr:MAG: DUF1634 domain-containing protein [Rhodospirillaceae bacterium]